MGCIRLERIEPETNKRRYYLVTWARTLWNTWAVWRQWGRLGQKVRGSRIDECANQDDALHLAAETIELRMRHGYTLKQTCSPTERHAKDVDDTVSPGTADP